MLLPSAVHSNTSVRLTEKKPDRPLLLGMKVGVCGCVWVGGGGFGGETEGAWNPESFTVKADVGICSLIETYANDEISSSLKTHTVFSVAKRKVDVCDYICFRVIHIFSRERYQTILFERRKCIISLDKSHVKAYHIACEGRRQ